MILVIFRTVLLVQHHWTNLWKGRFINTNYYYYYYVYMYICTWPHHSVMYMDKDSSV